MTNGSPPGSSSKGGGRNSTFIVLAITVVVVILGCGVAALVGLGVLGEEDTETITGSITLFDLDGVDGGLTSCQGTGGYSDIDAGMDITVRDAEGTIVGSSSVRNMSEAEVRELLSDDEGQSDSDESNRSSDADVEDMLDTFDGFACPLAFEVEVATVDFYEIKIGRRGELSASREELEEDDWTVNYTIGE